MPESDAVKRLCEWARKEVESLELRGWAGDASRLAEILDAVEADQPRPSPAWDGKERRVVASFRRIIDGVLCWDDGMQWRMDRRGAKPAKEDK